MAGDDEVHDGASTKELLIEACRRNNTDLLQELIDDIPDEDQLSKILNETTTVMGNHLFHEAASQGNYQHNFECDPINRLEGDTPLHSAIRWINSEPPVQRPFGNALVDMMLEAGCSPRVKNKGGLTALQLVDPSNKELRELIQKHEYAALNAGDFVRPEDVAGSGNKSAAAVPQQADESDDDDAEFSGSDEEERAEWERRRREKRSRAMMSFTYTALPGGRHFRLLKIHPGSPSDSLDCELFTSNLDNAPPYTALSYVWGDPTETADVTCSGHACRVTRSLADGLRRIRKPDQLQFAWADAICINQKDTVEKGQQVDLMGAIYDTARDVLVWLGPDPTDSAHEAFRCLRAVNDKLYTGTDVESFQPTKDEMPYDTFLLNGEQVQTFAGAQRSVLGFVLGDRGKHCVGRLFGLPWFSRVWVLQEVGLATAATAYWGDASLDFAEIATFISNTYFTDDLRHFLGPDTAALLAGAPLYALWNVWSTYEKKNSWMYRKPELRAFADQLAAVCHIDFVLVLEASRYFNATNHLDHVYAFLGHPRARKPGSRDTWLKANYALDLQEQHRLLAASLAQESLNFLVQAHQTHETLRRDFGLPSWVPRWSEKKHPLHAEAFWEAWDASLRKSEREPFGAHVVDRVKLAVSAILIDAVDQLTPTMEPSQFGPIGMDAGGILETCWDLARRKPHPYPPDKAVLAFASTIRCHYQSQTESVVEQFAGYTMHANARFYETYLVPKGGAMMEMNAALKARKDFGAAFKAHASNRRFFNTRKKGYWGTGPAVVQPGDVCAVLFGADVPFLLRPTETAGEYSVVGACYMYRIVDGDAVRAWRNGEPGFVKEDIILV
ncbi:hypothetical protein ACRALDRAFT_1079888 [Sodiomyces alcalophilus JCM 7366]|uniref:uncharacterized protein n=1 Tax=Sodiomyces alcalophilus JCM 7366 TaxID=591952 RepID=UPI0039B3FFE8